MKKRFIFLVIFVLVSTIFTGIILYATAPRISLPEEEKITIYGYTEGDFVKSGSDNGIVGDIIITSFDAVETKVVIDVQALLQLAKYYILHENEMAIICKESDFSDVEKETLSFEHIYDKFFIAFNNKNKSANDLKKKFIEGLEIIKENGTFDEIVEKY